MPYFRRETRSGDLLEVEVYFATRDGRQLGRGQPTDEGTPRDVEANNEKQAQRRLMRLINANFSRRNGDMLVTWTHGVCVTEEEARLAETAVLKQVKRLRAKLGLEPLKYIAVTEKQGRWHTHAIINGGLSLEQLTAVWNRGRVQASILEDQSTYEGLARYLTEQHKPRRNRKAEAGAESLKQRRRKWQHRWHTSHNLKQPEVVKKPVKRMPRIGEPKARKGYRLLPDWYVGCDCFGNMYSYAAYWKDEPPASSERSEPFAVVKKGPGAARRGEGQSPRPRKPIKGKRG